MSIELYGLICLVLLGISVFLQVVYVITKGRAR